MSTLTAETEQIVKSAASPSYFARRTTTRDSSTGRFVPFQPWEHQARLLAALCRSRRLAVLHGAGTGTTTAVLAYAVWTALFRPGTTVRLHGTAHGETLVKQARHLVYRLPRHLRPDAITVETSHELSFSTGSRIVGFDPGHDVALVVADGEGFEAADTAPARQTVLLSRPGSGAFEGLYRGGRYERLFVPFSARPGRTGLSAGAGPESEAEALGETGEEAVPPFAEFVEWAWPLVSNDPFKTGLHVEAITRHLQLVADGQVRKLVIQCPIRHGKSLLTSVLNPVWRWLRDPALRVMTSTYSQELTLRDANRSKLLVEHPRFRERFGRRLALADSNTRLDFYHTGKGGYRFSTSVGARTSGFDADAIIADDLHPMSDRYSRADRERAIDYFFTTLSNRLVLTGRESLVLAGHRVHEQDVMQAVVERFGGEFTYLVLPAEADPEYTRAFPNRYWTDPRKPGELLWPAVFGPEQLTEKKKELRHDYSPVFNQKPVPPEGSLFRVDWFRSYSPQDGNYRLGEKTFNRAGFTRVITVDLAIGQKATRTGPSPRSGTSASDRWSSSIRPASGSMGPG